MPGRFIVLEGPDGSGTSTHSKLLAARLEEEGFDVLLTAEPTDGLIGSQIRTFLHSENPPPADALQLLFCSDRAEHVAEEILPALEQGKIVICDRYTLSTIVYGSVHNVDAEWLKDVNRHFPTPDLTIITLPPLEDCLRRVDKRETQDHFENGGMQEKIYEAYAEIKHPSTVFVDTSNDKDATAEEIWQHAKPLLQPATREGIAEMG